MVKRSWILGLTALLVVFGISGVAQAATVFYSDSFAMTTTNWNGLLEITKFDSSLGTLTGINFLLEGEVLGNVRFESLDAQPTTVDTYLQAVITLTRPDASTIVVTTPVSNHSDNVSEFDGVIDFDGTSGKSYFGLTANSSESVDSPPPGSDLALFTGVGSIFLPIMAEGASLATGAGNLITIFNTEAAARATVTYTYDPVTPPVPEASSLLLILVGGGFMALGSRMRNRRK